MFDHSLFFTAILKTRLAPFADALKEAIRHRESARVFGELGEWQQALDTLPDLKVSRFDLSADTVTIETEVPLKEEEKQQITHELMTLHPWRKGPFNFFGISVNTEWRSDWKWQRISQHISDLTGKTVLDVGCGSGYHALRMYGEGAALVVGIEPMPKYIFQFLAFKKYLPEIPVYLLPLLCEDIPPDMQAFDTVFSMGVLYHRKSPIAHLEELKNLLRPGGELVLETLIIEGDSRSVLVPEGRYAKMRNVWFIPSVTQLEIWLRKTGFRDVKTVDITVTTTEEQRATPWMHFQSLADFLDPSNPAKTIEGYPAPLRATVIARK